MARKHYAFHSLHIIAGVFALVSLTHQVVRRTLGFAGEMLNKLFAKKDRIMWAKSHPVIPVAKSVFARKPDKERSFMSFLRVKQSWAYG